MTTLQEALRAALGHPDPHLDGETLAALVDRAEHAIGDDVARIHAAATAVVAEAEATVRADADEADLTEAARVQGARDLLTLPDSGVGTISAETQCARVRRTARDRWQVDDRRIARPGTVAEVAALLADVLADLAASGVGLVDMGSGDFQALAGALSTATHGSGVDKPAFPGMVRALDVVALGDDGAPARLRIEPRDGPTDPARFSGADADGPIRLVQDDDTFDTWLVSLGCLGVITAVTMQAVPAFWLSETRTVGWWSELRGTLGQELAAVPYFEVLLSPWSTPHPTTGAPDHAVLITRRHVVPAPPDGRPAGGRPITMRLAQLPVGRLAAQVALLHALADPLRRVPGLLKTGTTATQVDRYIDRSPEVLLLRLDLNAQSSELAVPLEVVAGAPCADRAIAAAERLLERAAAARAAWEQRLHGVPGRPPRDAVLGLLREHPLHTSPIALRFTAGGRGLLAMQQGGPTCLLEMPMPGVDLYDRTPDPGSRLGALYAAYDEGRRALFAAAERDLGEALGARPHWGQRNALRWADVQALYPEAARWRVVYDKANAAGTFDGPLTDQLGISRGP